MQIQKDATHLNKSIPYNGTAHCFSKYNALSSRLQKIHLYIMMLFNKLIKS